MDAVIRFRHLAKGACKKNDLQQSAMTLTPPYLPAILQVFFCEHIYVFETGYATEKVILKKSKSPLKKIICSGNWKTGKETLRNGHRVVI